jgi:hypothetical protein
MQTVIQISRRLDSFLHEATQNFELLSNIQDQKLKLKKPIAVDVLFKAYPMVPLSCRSNLADGTFKSPKFIWAPCSQQFSLAEARNIAPHLGSNTRALLVSQDRRHFFVTPDLRPQKYAK